MKKSNRIIVTIISLVLIALMAWLIVGWINNSKTVEVSYDVFEEKVEDGTINKVYFEGSYWVFGYSTVNGNTAEFKALYSSRGDAAEIINSWNQTRGKGSFANLKVIFNDPNANSFWVSALPIIAVVLLGIFFLFMVTRMQGGKIADFGKVNNQAQKNSRVRFNDVAGAEEEKEELKEIVDFLKNPRKYSEVGAKIPRGVLLVGPPGTGKTLFAKAVAGEANVPFFTISGSDFVEMYVGVGASRVRSLFENAKKNQPCIIFIDEIDAVGRQRGTGLGGGHDEREQTLNQLLVQMDGFDENDGIIIMAATNRADILDPALMRPGRFDRQITVNPPDVRGREEILKVHSRNKPLASDVDFKVLAKITSGFTGADISNLLNEAAILTVRNNRKLISMHDITDSINKVIVGPQKRSRIVTERDKRITAYHEAGHAILAYSLKNCDPVQEVSIIPRGMAAGYTMTRPDNDDSHILKGKLKDNIAMLLGGRVAEEIVIKDISTGASSDLKRASSIARSMVTEWGMSEKLGDMYWGTEHEVFLGRNYQSQTSYSESIATIIDAEIKSILEEAHSLAQETLLKYRSCIDVMARLLIERETIYNADVEMIMQGKSYAEILEIMLKKDEEDKKRHEEKQKFVNPTIIDNVVKTKANVPAQEKKQNSSEQAKDDLGDEENK